MQGRRQGGLGVLKHAKNLLVTRVFCYVQSVKFLPDCIILAFFRVQNFPGGYYILRPPIWSVILILLLEHCHTSRLDLPLHEHPLF